MSSINLTLGFLALFAYSQEYDVDFWFFAQSPTPALASVFLLYATLTLLIGVYYAMTAVNLQVKDSIKLIESDQPKERAKWVLFNLQVGIVVVTALCFGAIALPSSVVSNPCVQWLKSSAQYVLATAPFAAWALFIGWTYCSLVKEEGKRLRKDSATMVFALVMLLMGMLVLIIVPVLNGLDILIGNYEWLNKLLNWQFGGFALLILTTLVTGLLLIYAFGATEIDPDKQSRITPDNQSIRKQLLRPLRTTQFGVLLALVVFAFLFNIIPLSFFAERSLLATGFATQYSDTAETKQSAWADERLGAAVDNFSFEEAILYESKEWRILYKGTNASLIEVKQGGITNTFELPTSSPLLRFYREKESENDT